MGSYRQVFYHLVFGTKHRAPVIEPAHEEELHKYMGGVIKDAYYTA